MGTGHGAFWRAALAGLASVGVIAAAVLLIASQLGGRPTSPNRGAAARLSMVTEQQRLDTQPTAGDLASLRKARKIARGQLRIAGRALWSCPSRARIAVRRWRGCVREPLAHLAIDGRTMGGVLYAVAGSPGLARCRDQPMGEASSLRVLGSQSDQLVRGLANSSPAARAETARLFTSTRHLITDLRRQLRRPVSGCADSR